MVIIMLKTIDIHDPVKFDDEKVVKAIGKANDAVKEAERQQRIQFAERLRFYRSAANLTQEQLAAKTGMSQTIITRYETAGALPRKKAIEKLAAALNVSVSDLDGSTNNAEKLHLVNFFNSLRDPKTFNVRAKLNDTCDKVLIYDSDPKGTFEIEMSFDVFNKIMSKTEADTAAYLIPWRMLTLRTFLRENIYFEILFQTEKSDPETATKLKNFMQTGISTTNTPPPADQGADESPAE